MIGSDAINAYICTPAYDGGVTSDFAQSMAEAAFCAPLYGIKITAGVMGNGAFIDLARNIFVMKMLREFPDCTHLFFIDADLRFEPRAFIGLLKADLPICAGIYRRRQEPEDYPFHFAPNPEGGGLWFVNDWLQCNRVPTGFLCIRRDVLEAMAADAPTIRMTQIGRDGKPEIYEVPWLFHTGYNGADAELKAIAAKHNLSAEFVEQYGAFIPRSGASYIGEDYSFCDSYVKRYGQPIPVWANFDFIHGGYRGNLYQWLSKRKDEADAKAHLPPLLPEASAA